MPTSSSPCLTMAATLALSANQPPATRVMLKRGALPASCGPAASSSAAAFFGS